MTQLLTVLPADGATTVGGYFVSNYPPFAYWTTDGAADARAMLNQPPTPGVPLGVYVHIPFCRKRCTFCYFKVYTEKNADEINAYLDAVSAEAARYAALPSIHGRKPRFVYFGGGTPSYLSTEQLGRLFSALQSGLPWDEVEEVTFECEPGTISEAKLSVLKEKGVTRLSLGVENFDDTILEINGRAHRSSHAFKAYEAARRVGLPQINIDLIAGMVGETPENWRRCIDQTIALSPDSVTIYQMEVPRNTGIASEMRRQGQTEAPVADWATKRAWVGEAFAALESAGYRVSSAYTVVKASSKAGFKYRDELWHGADLLGLGVSSFSHLNGVHFQNEKELEAYIAQVSAGTLPIQRGLALTAQDRLIRELILQMKLGSVRTAHFLDKFGVDVQQQLAAPLRALTESGLAKLSPDRIELSREALLKVDALLPAFYQPMHRG
jgi:oxygen-independent coproporphyrinogen-3 oxidase